MTLSFNSRGTNTHPLGFLSREICLRVRIYNRRSVYSKENDQGLVTDLWCVYTVMFSRLFLSLAALPLTFSSNLCHTSSRQGNVYVPELATTSVIMSTEGRLHICFWWKGEQSAAGILQKTYSTPLL